MLASSGTKGFFEEQPAATAAARPAAMNSLLELLSLFIAVAVLMIRSSVSL
jgi:hypothetical protein